VRWLDCRSSQRDPLAVPRRSHGGQARRYRSIQERRNHDARRLPGPTSRSSRHHRRRRPGRDSLHTAWHSRRGLMGVPPTGTSASSDGMVFARVHDGKVIERWASRTCCPSSSRSAHFRRPRRRRDRQRSSQRQPGTTRRYHHRCPGHLGR